MNVTSRPVPWQTPKQDPIFKQLADVCSWLATLAPHSHERPIRDLSENLRFHWREFISFERVAVYERVLGAWVQLVEHGGLDHHLWEAAGSQSKGNVDQRLAALKGGVRLVAIAFYPHDAAAQDSWELSFFADERVSPTKLRRLAREFKHVVDELNEVPAKLAARRRAFEASGLPATLALPTADGLFLHAHDAQLPPSSRFQRFRFFVSALIVVYRNSASRNAHDSYAVPRLEAVCVPLESEQQAQAFAALPLELQVSAVEHVRELVFDTCKRAQTGKDLLTSERMVGLLESAFTGHQHAVAAPASLVSTHAYAYADEAYRNELARLTGGEHAEPSRSQTPRSLGKEASCRFFPAARTASW
ncbi:hypothetical protein JCM9279_004012 [Rhodotorula babjevae]